MDRAGGRPKALDVWEHVTVLKGKRVKCKYCEFVFAASANRIKSHIYQIKGHGIRLCTRFPPPCNVGSNETVREDLKDNLNDSQGVSTLERARDYNKFNERMLDCYMSPKAMWEGIMAIPQAEKIITETKHQGRIQVGPFLISKKLNAGKRIMHGAEGRPKSEVWKHVREVEGNQVKCNSCDFIFAKSANRIKFHFDPIEHKGIRLCAQFHATSTDSNKRLKPNISASNLEKNPPNNLEGSNYALQSYGSSPESDLTFVDETEPQWDDSSDNFGLQKFPSCEIDWASLRRPRVICISLSSEESVLLWIWIVSILVVQ